MWGLDLEFRVWGLRLGVCLVFSVWCLEFGVWGLGFGVWYLGSGVWGLGFGIWGLGFRVKVSRRLALDCLCRLASPYQNSLGSGETRNRNKQWLVQGFAMSRGRHSGGSSCTPLTWFRVSGSGFRSLTRGKSISQFKTRCVITSGHLLVGRVTDGLSIGNVTSCITDPGRDRIINI